MVRADTEHPRRTGEIEEDNEISVIVFLSPSSLAIGDVIAKGQF